MGFAKHMVLAQSSPPPLPACDTASDDFDGDGVLNDADADRTDSCLCIQPNCAEGQTCVDDPDTLDENEAGTGDGNPECDDTGIPYPDEV